jgi:hypothetical protein
MKNLLPLTLALAIISSPLLAQEPAEEPVANDAYCEMISKLSEQIMSSRQKGVSLSTVLGIAKSDMVRTIVMDAWETPRFFMESLSQREIDDFRDKWHLLCLKSVSE